MRNRIEEETGISYPPPPHAPPTGPSRPRGEEESLFIKGRIMGYFIEITKVDYPESALSGQTVEVKVTVKNPATTLSQYILVMGGYDNTTFYSTPEHALVSPGASKTFTMSFPMPNKSIVYSIWSYIWVEYPDQAGYWYNDDSRGITISLELPPSGRITSTVLEHSGIYDTLPVSGLSSGKGKIHVHAKNTSQSTRSLRVVYDVVGPSGNTLYHFDDTDHYADPDEDCDFHPLIATFEMNDLGNYYVESTLYVDGAIKDAVHVYFNVSQAPPPEEKLIISVTPTGTGTVTASPSPKRISGNDWIYDYGTIVTVTAHPKKGYKFEKWSDEIVGGVSTSNPAQVKPMTEDRGVLAHFIEVELPPECSIDADCPKGYICKGGVCIPAEEKYPCPYCDETFATQEELNAHIKSVHPGKKPVGTNWTPILIGSGVLIAAVALGSKKKPGEKKAIKK